MADNVRQALQGSGISNNAHARFTDAEDCILCCQPHVTGTDQINSGADTVAVNRSNDRFTARFDFCETLLKLPNFFSHAVATVSGALTE